MALSLWFPDSFVRRFPASTIAVDRLFCERSGATACHRISQWQMAVHDFVNMAAKRERGRAPELSLVFTEGQAGKIRRGATSELMRRKCAAGHPEHEIQGDIMSKKSCAALIA